jgi:hypothetical protein
MTKNTLGFAQIQTHICVFGNQKFHCLISDSNILWEKLSPHYFYEKINKECLPGAKRKHN